MAKFTLFAVAYLAIAAIIVFLGSYFDKENGNDYIMPGLAWIVCVPLGVVVYLLFFVSDTAKKLKERRG